MAGEQQDDLAAAIRSEREIAERAAKIRDEHDGDEVALFHKLYPLCREPIPAGFIVKSGAVKGKPYDSTGVKSVQVLFDRMDNVFGPLWWRESVAYVGGTGESDRGTPNEGRLAVVTVDVGPDPEKPLFSRASRGGVNQASTIGNLYKGTYTNAAKLAFARVGPGHEIYLGAADYDPDTNADAAKAQERSTGGGNTAAAPANDGPIGPDRGEKLLAKVQAKPAAAAQLENKLRGFGVKTPGELTEAQGMKLLEWADDVSAGEEPQAPPTGGSDEGDRQPAADTSAGETK